MSDFQWNSGEPVKAGTTISGVLITMRKAGNPKVKGNRVFIVTKGREIDLETKQYGQADRRFSELFDV